MSTPKPLLTNMSLSYDSETWPISILDNVEIAKPVAVLNCASVKPLRRRKARMASLGDSLLLALDGSIDTVWRTTSFVRSAGRRSFGGRGSSPRTRERTVSAIDSFEAHVTGAAGIHSEAPDRAVPAVDRQRHANLRVRRVSDD